MPEKRDINRRLKRLTVKFGDDTPLHVGFTGDISNTGIFLKTNKVYPLNTLLIIELHTPDNIIIEFQGKVMWGKTVPPGLAYTAKKVGMGIKIMKFLKGEEEYRRLVEISHHYKEIKVKAKVEVRFLRSFLNLDLNLILFL